MTGWKPIYQLLSDFRYFEILRYLSTRPLISNLRKCSYFSADCCCSAIQTVRRILLPPPQHQPQSLWPWGVPLPVHLSQWSHLQPKVLYLCSNILDITPSPRTLGSRLSACGLFSGPPTCSCPDGANFTASIANIINNAFGGIFGWFFNKQLSSCKFNINLKLPMFQWK